MGPDNYIKMEDCKARHVYKLASRNLSLGVWNSESEGFIGIRVKFGEEYLFTEYHWDTGPPHGTAKPLEDLGELEDEHIQLMECYPNVCSHCGERVEYIRKNKSSYDGKWEHFIDTKCAKARPSSITNTMLFNALRKLESEDSGDL